MCTLHIIQVVFFIKGSVSFIFVILLCLCVDYSQTHLDSKSFLWNDFLKTFPFSTKYLLIYLIFPKLIKKCFPIISLISGAYRNVVTTFNSNRYPANILENLQAEASPQQYVVVYTLWQLENYDLVCFKIHLEILQFKSPQMGLIIGLDLVQ